MSLAGDVARISLPGTDLPEAVARHLITQHGDLLPDLSALIVLVPNRRAGADFARLLAQVSARPALIPPLITPLKAWAARHQAGTEAEPHTRRLARLHGVLRQQAWLGEVDRWALAAELLQLADELSAAHLGEADTEQIGARIRGLNGRALERESALIEAVWLAMNSGGNDPQACYARGLAAIPADRPVYGFSLGPLTARETRFLERYAQSAPVTLFSQDQSASSVGKTLFAAWAGQEPPLIERAAELASTHPQSPVAGRVTLSAAPHLEAEARAVASWVAGQLQAGRERIALIALDRETARRARALLERLHVLAADETGWTLSTTAAAAIIDRWLECLASDFPHAELLDLLKSPFLSNGEPARQDAVLALEAAMRGQGLAQGLNEIRRLALNLDPPASFLDTLADAARNFSQARAPLAVWLGRLLDSLAQMQAMDALAADAAGSNLLDTLKRLQAELAPDTGKYRFAEWRRWLNLALETETFTDTRVSSPVVMTSLPNARGRQFDAVALIGADALRLPARPARGLFSQTARAQLGLPGTTEAMAQTTEDVLQLLSQGESLITWQAWHNDEPNPASSYVLRLQALHQAAWQSEISEQEIGLPPAQQDGGPGPARQPVPIVPAANLPRRYSASAYQTLLDCPYRFFARHVLGLRELDEADEPLDKSDYGSALHRILEKFHDSDPPPDAGTALARLDEISAAEFARLPAYTAAAWQSKWNEIQPAYIDAWLQWANEGWRYQSGETDLHASQDVPGLGEVELHGVIDRIDANAQTLCVFDYKTTSASTLRKKLKTPDEAVQLPFYSWLAGASAAFLPINDTPVAPLALNGETDAEAIALRLPKLLEAMAAGAPLPANGIDAVCAYCEARGLCRKGNWHE